MDSTSDAPDPLAMAIGAHQRGDVAAAELGYRAILAGDAQNANALHFLAVLRHQCADEEEALALFDRALRLMPEDFGFWQNLGNVLVESGRLEDAIKAYDGAMERCPDQESRAGLHNNLGLLRRALGDLPAAERELRRALEIAPNHLDALHNLANVAVAQGHIQEASNHALRLITLTAGEPSQRHALGAAYRALGQFDKAAEVYRQWLSDEPDNPRALHYLAACHASATPTRAADDYVEATFDAFASSFDAKLERLEYRAPQLIAQALRDQLGVANAGLDIADLGCGTGLCGPLVRPYAQLLIGVDLSVNMLRRARARKCYDKLFKVEITRFLADHERRFDVLLSADTLCYFGGLEEVLSAASHALRPGGRLLFTVEAVDAGDVADTGYRMESSGRYAHARGYLQATLTGAGLETICVEKCVLRQESGMPVDGWLVAAAKI